MTCLTCGSDFEAKRGHHRYCSAACRLQAFLARREALRQNRDAQVRMLLTAALEAVQEARALLKGQPSSPERAP